MGVISLFVALPYNDCFPLTIKVSIMQPGRWHYSRRARLIFIPVFVLALVNFASFIIVDQYLGGDALNGYTKDGHYFLCNHGWHTEVSRAVWTYSYYHAISIVVTHGSVFALAALFLITGDMAIRRDPFSR